MKFNASVGLYPSDLFEYSSLHSMTTATHPLNRCWENVIWSFECTKYKGQSNLA